MASLLHAQAYSAPHHLVNYCNIAAGCDKHATHATKLNHRSKMASLLFVHTKHSSTKQQAMLCMYKVCMKPVQLQHCSTALWKLAWYALDVMDGA